MRKHPPTTKQPEPSSDCSRGTGKTTQDDQDAPNAKGMVGYGKPPTHSQFQPGVSGNPAGRPRGARNLSTLVSTELNKSVSVREGGQVRRLPKRVALVAGMVNKALQGDHRAIGLLIPLLLRMEVEQAARDQPDQPLAPDDLALLADYVRRVNGKKPDEE